MRGRGSFLRPSPLPSGASSYTSMLSDCLTLEPQQAVCPMSFHGCCRGVQLERCSYLVCSCDVLLSAFNLDSQARTAKQHWPHVVSSATVLRSRLLDVKAIVILMEEYLVDKCSMLSDVVAGAKEL